MQPVQHPKTNQFHLNSMGCKLKIANYYRKFQEIAIIVLIWITLADDIKINNFDSIEAWMRRKMGKNKQCVLFTTEKY
jgi:hypothetical protein